MPSKASKPASSTDQPPALSRRKKLLFAGLTTLLVLGLLEVSLRLLGIPAAPSRDVWAGFSPYAPLLQSAKDPLGRDVYTTRPEKLTWFNEQAFTAQKPTSGKRVFTVGGSTTYGRPYNDATSFTGWLREYIRAAESRVQNWEVVNAGGISYASYRVVNVMRELAEHEPDVFIVYTGHNEFLERRTYAAEFERPTTQQVSHLLSRFHIWQSLNNWLRQPHQPLGKQQDGKTRQGAKHPEGGANNDGHDKRDGSDGLVQGLPEEVDEILNHTVGPVDYHRDEAWRQQVVEHYRRNLHQMIDIAEDCGAAIIFVTPVSNESHCSPFKSEFGEATTPERQQEALAALDAALGLLHRDAPDPVAAMPLLQKAIAIDPQFAESHYWLGRAQYAQEEYAEAAKSFQEAMEQDICPLRATEAIHAALRNVTASRGVRLIDFQKQLRAAQLANAGHRILGEEQLLDHVHPTIDAHQQLAHSLLESLSTLPGCEITLPLPPAAEQKADQLVRDKINVVEHGIARRNLAKVLHWAGKFEEAASHAAGALEPLPGDAESMYILADCNRLLGQPELAYGLFQELLIQHPTYDRARIPLGVLHYQRDEFAEAKRHLTLGLIAYPDSTYGAYWLGVTHLALNEPQKAEEVLREALAHSSDDPGTLFALGEACAVQGNHEDAETYFQQVLQRLPEHAETHNALGWLHLDQQKPQDAQRHFQQTLKSLPQHTEAKAGLERATELLGPAP